MSQNESQRERWAVDAVMGPDRTRPLVLGFVLRSLFATDGEVVRVEQELARFAAAEGYAMGAVFVEDSATRLAAFAALIEAIGRDEASAVVVPSVLHLSALACRRDLKGTFERATGARVLALWPVRFPEGFCR